jgi:hypothetical protein
LQEIPLQAGQRVVGKHLLILLFFLDDFFPKPMSIMPGSQAIKDSAKQKIGIYSRARPKHIRCYMVRTKDLLIG